MIYNKQSMEAGGNNRSVMPLDVLGRTRATLIKAASNECLSDAEAGGRTRRLREEAEANW